jgi:hypothetical protein
MVVRSSGPPKEQAEQQQHCGDRRGNESGRTDVFGVDARRDGDERQA